MNKLQFETSPYLLQHKSNPVDWYPWGNEAIAKAKNEDKPIILSIGYSSCHWCHVMEQESFSDENVAIYMNKHFICIKLDREERPDLDKIYMDAIVSLSGSGGWPLNCFLLPDLKPFYGGTYFPPKAGHQRPSWMDILQFIVRIYKERKEDIIDQADRMLESINRSSASLYSISQTDKDKILSKQDFDDCFSRLASKFDRSHGGFGGSPKFPSTMTLTFLLDYYFFNGNKTALDHVVFSLQKMASAGIYDQLAGGFARYATDKEWNIPHFEKMLYDNAQLLSVFSKTFKYVPDPLFKKVVLETTHWLDQSMRSPEGGYYSAIDADSDHEEGKYYVWTMYELKNILNAQELTLAQNVFDLHDDGNWDDPFHPGVIPKNILWLNAGDAVQKQILSRTFQQLQQKLLSHRALRNHPLIDNKVIVSWNALLCLGWYDAYEAFGEMTYFTRSEVLLDYILKNCFADSYQHQIGSKIPAMLDDIGFTIAACLKSYQLGNKPRLSNAIMLIKYALENYFIPSDKSFLYSIPNTDIITNTDDIYDSTMPSSTAMMAYNLVVAGRISHELEWEKLGEEILQNLQKAVITYTESLSFWASCLINKVHGWIEIKISENGQSAALKNMYTSKSISISIQSKETEFTLCHQYICEMPASSFEKFRLLLDNHYHSRA